MNRYLLSLLLLVVAKCLCSSCSREVMCSTKELKNRCFEANVRNSLNNEEHYSRIEFGEDSVCLKTSRSNLNQCGIYEVAGDSLFLRYDEFLYNVYRLSKRNGEYQIRTFIKRPIFFRDQNSRKGYITYTEKECPFP